MSEQSFHKVHSGSGFTFAELSTDVQLEWLADYLYRLQGAAAGLFDESGNRTDLGTEIEAAALLVKQVRHRVVAESSALQDRLRQHGDNAVIQLGHELRPYFEPG